LLEGMPVDESKKDDFVGIASFAVICGAAPAAGPATRFAPPAGERVSSPRRQARARPAAKPPVPRHKKPAAS
jgi:hypothetical protein